MQPEPYIISLDWFQVNCSRPLTQALEERQFLQGTINPENNKPSLYETVRSKEFNPMFQHSMGVAMHGFQICTIFYDPRPTSLKKTMCSIKMGNRILYSGNWAYYLVDIARALGWTINNITRVDLCADFHHFSGHLHPRTFIDRYLATGDYDPEKPIYYRKGSNKFYTIGRKSVSEFGNTMRATNSSDYLRFGTRSTGVSAYLYNKSAELRDKKDKPYISDIWAKAGLLQPDPDGTVNDIYRLELSINAGGLNVKRLKDPEEKADTRTAIYMLTNNVRPLEVERLATDDFLTQAAIENLFFAYASKYFAFQVMGPQKYKQYWPTLNLFDVQLKPTVKPYTISRTFGTGVKERNAANAIQQLLTTCRDLTLPQMISLDAACTVLQRYAKIMQTSAEREEITNIIEALHEGHTFDELPRMAICSSTHLQEFKQIVNESIFHELRELLTDSSVAYAVNQYEAERELIEEQARVIDDYFSHESAHYNAQ